MFHAQRDGAGVVVLVVGVGLGEAQFQHGALGRGHLDAAVVVDIAGQALEITGADLIRGSGGGDAAGRDVKGPGDASFKKETGDFGRLSGSADVFFHGTYDVGMAAAGVL